MSGPELRVSKNNPESPLLVTADPLLLHQIYGQIHLNQVEFLLSII